MQAPGRLNLKLPQGATWIIPMTWTDSTGQEIDLTDYHAHMQVRTSYDAATAELDLSDGIGITLGGVLGTITVTVADTVTATIDAGRYVWDLEMSTTTTTTRLLQGTLTVTPEVTKEVTP